MYFIQSIVLFEQLVQVTETSNLGQMFLTVWRSSIHTIILTRSNWSHATKWRKIGRSTTMKHANLSRS